MPRDDEDWRAEQAELRAEDLAERRRMNRRCECGDDLPGHCPGPDACPYAHHDTENDDDARIEP